MAGGDLCHEFGGEGRIKIWELEDEKTRRLEKAVAVFVMVTMFTNPASLA